MRARLGACLVALPLILAASACSDGDQTEEPTAPGQVELGYALPAGMKEVAIPSATPTAGMQYDIKLFTGKNDCELRVVRMKLPKGDGTEDQDATYNMLGAIMESSGVRAVVADAPVGVGPVGSLLLLWIVAACLGLLAVVRRRRLTPARYRRGAGRAQ